MTMANVSLREKFYGCIAGVHIGSAMAAPVEGWKWQKIKEEYGVLEKFLPYQHYKNSNSWIREPGTTEDGVERQKLMITAIMEKQDRINVEDLRKAWIKHMNPRAPGYISEPFEGALLELAKSSISAADIGKYCDYAGLVTLGRACHPIGLINAGDIQNAVADLLNVGQIYCTANSSAINWATVVVVAIAEATKRGATVDSVIGAIYDYAGKYYSAEEKYIKHVQVVAEIDRGLKLTSGCKDFEELRSAFDDLYSGFGMTYPYSFANEVITKGVCIFRMVKGNLKDAIISGVNMGRDTDCATAIAAGMAGALTGGELLPEEWAKQVDYASSVNEYTNTRRTVREHSDGLYNAFKARTKKLKEYVDEMDMD